MTAQTAGIVQARRTVTARRRERALKALDAAVQAQDEINVSGIARRAGVDRTSSTVTVTATATSSALSRNGRRSRFLPARRP
ncbi:hypothetical protein [Streptomyces sp. NPDC048442]|uniref:hypothetical protein n=1 Tax=Streptomyces sp. NPDC048442 TaxID=3154823 RepID=UPI003412930E